MAWYSDVHSSRKNMLGVLKIVDNKAFVYLKGVASTVLGSWVSFDEAGVSTLAVANAQGRVAVAMGAVDSTSKYGWYQVYGSVPAKALTLFADNGKVYLTATPGSVDDTDVAGDAVIGAVGRSAVNESTLLATFELNFPQVLDIAVD